MQGRQPGESVAVGAHEEQEEDESGFAECERTEVKRQGGEHGTDIVLQA